MRKLFRKVSNPKKVREFNMKNINENDLRSYGWIPYEKPEKVIEKEKNDAIPKVSDYNIEETEDGGVNISKKIPGLKTKPEPSIEPESTDFEIPEIKEETEEKPKPAAKKPGRKPKTKTAKK